MDPVPKLSVAKAFPAEISLLSSRLVVEPFPATLGARWHTTKARQRLQGVGTKDVVLRLAGLVNSKGRGPSAHLA